ncbi:putative nuclease HARBI1 [Cydia splendana]|uniref:putative nuclease HARBI1 n=1 Tax=Cydia splendana TaxID=1100963 RepID=UPI00214001E9
MHSLRLLWAAHNAEVLRRRRRRQQNRLRLETVEKMPELLFIQQFRLSKSVFKQLCSDLRTQTRLRGTREIPLEIKVLCALSFYATGSDQRIVGLTQHLTQRTASRCIRQVTNALNCENISDKWIVFPQTQQERTVLTQEFQRRFRLPGIIGAIDCTHVATAKPDTQEHLFFNRKGYHSLNVQMICDHELIIRNINPKFGGATHDAHIWASSIIEPYMRGLHQNGEQVWLLGDSGYPLRPWVMTPVLNAAPGSREETYTKRHVRARNCIERCFGLLKSRWRCLNKKRTLNYQPYVASQITLACCVLHNIAIIANLPPPNDGSDIENDGDDHSSSVTASLNVSGQNDLLRGRAVLNNLISRL